MKKFLLLIVCFFVPASFYAQTNNLQTAIEKCTAHPIPQTIDAIDMQKAAERVHWLINAHRLKDAEEFAQQELNAYPDSVELNVALGKVRYQQGKLSAATQLFNRVLSADGCNAQAHYYAWRFYARKDHAVEARQHLEEAHALAPQDAMISRTWEAVQQAIELEDTPGALQVQALTPARANFFSKTLDCGGIPVRSAADIDSDALVLACGKIRRMLRNDPEARKRLARNKAELHIIGEFQGTADLPENRQYQSSAYVDAEGHATDMNARTRGVGGLLSSCGEENLLHLPGDRYGDGSDTCTHEFAHDLMNHGLSDRQERAIEQQYHAALAKGLWKGAYAAVNPEEYWAELSMWYFGSHGNRVAGALMEAGPEALKSYDSEGYKLLVTIYGSLE